jgi:hypothetical protein
MTRLVITLAVLGFLAVNVVAQAPAYRPARTSFGQPDLQGIWQAVNTAVWNIQDHPAQLGVPAGQGVVEGNEIPYLPLAVGRRADNFRNRFTADPESKCHMVGTPRINYMPYPFEIVQTQNQITMLYEYVHTSRHIYLNSKHPEGKIQWYMGDSRGTWDGDTLVVDVTHFTDTNWFDRSGNFHSDNMHLVERWTRTSADHIWYEATVEDPTVFARPWKIRFPLYRRIEPTVQLLEYECQTYLELERERTAGTLPGER